MPLEPTEVTFGLSPRYGILNARDAHDWFPRMVGVYKEFEVETDRAGEWPMPFWSETVRRMVWWSRAKSSVFNLSVRALGNRII